MPGPVWRHLVRGVPRRLRERVVTPRREPARPRSIRVRDGLWAAAMAKAGERGEVLSEEIVKFLERYARKR